MTSLHEISLETCAKCIINRECSYFCIICDKIFCNECIETLKQLCSDCSNILLLRDKNRSEESLKEYFIKENNLDNFVKMIQSMNNFLIGEKDKLNQIEQQLKDKEKLISEQKKIVENVNKSENSNNGKIKSEANTKRIIKK